ncbi:hypothetical protein R1sor_015739 [Riccia sorocarpa]|uniref:Uncharacterized protein n=1 Tax=Riccia sorocarpa TaxID=122646 RepID=A0ABD3HD25_9MARC
MVDLWCQGLLPDGRGELDPEKPKRHAPASVSKSHFRAFKTLPSDEAVLKVLKAVIDKKVLYKKDPECTVDILSMEEYAKALKDDASTVQKIISFYSSEYQIVVTENELENEFGLNFKERARLSALLQPVAKGAKKRKLDPSIVKAEDARHDLDTSFVFVQFSREISFEINTSVVQKIVNNVFLMTARKRMVFAFVCAPGADMVQILMAFNDYDDIDVTFEIGTYQPMDDSIDGFWKTSSDDILILVKVCEKSSVVEWKDIVPKNRQPVRLNFLRSEQQDVEFSLPLKKEPTNVKETKQQRKYMEDRNRELRLFSGAPKYHYCHGH